MKIKAEVTYECEITDKEVEKFTAKILKDLEFKLGISLR